MLSEREDIAIAQIAVYLPALVVAIYVSVRHGFVRQMGWVYLVIFCVLRIAAVSQYVALDAQISCLILESQVLLQQHFALKAPHTSFASSREALLTPTSSRPLCKCSV